MPKIVDHEARRVAITEAYWRVVRREGVEAASVRAVATEAAMTPGAMRHYFDDHEALQRAAMAAMVERVRARVAAANTGDGPLGERASRVLRELLPLDDERQAETEVWFAFVAAARFDETFRPLAEASYDAIRSLVGEVVDGLVPTASCAVAEVETERLFALVDGLALHAAQRPGHVPVSRMTAVLDAHLAALAAGTPSGAETHAR